jgi:hypothetical protein
VAKYWWILLFVNASVKHVHRNAVTKMIVIETSGLSSCSTNLRLFSWLFHLKVKYTFAYFTFIN